MTDRCGAYAEWWEELGKPQGWLGCSLPKGHDGPHMDKTKYPATSQSDAPQVSLDSEAGEG